jgi:hypothetical protein
MKIIKWTARILAILLLLFGLPFYFGYGNPLPFINPDYTLHDNLWLTIFPLMFIGLALGWKNEKIGGYLTVIPLLTGFIVSILIIRTDFTPFMLIPFTVGILYLIVGYKKINNKNK